MKLLLLGARGQLGWELQRSLAPLGEVIALHRASTPAADLARPQDLARTIAALAPDAVVNAAAYTAVDKAETERELAFAVNGKACEAIAEAAKSCGAWVVHYSTDYVFDGGGERPWRESDATSPVNAYGASKLAGEQALAGSGVPHLVFRTSWVFETWGQNFAKSMLRLAAQREQLRVVADQWGAPTRAALIADVTAHALRQVAGVAGAQDKSGIYHLAAGGETNWHRYAQLVLEQARAEGLPVKVRAEAVEPIITADYPVPAKRPANSRLDTTRLRQTFGLALPPWEDGVRAVVSEIAAQARERTP
jgi:dTDP-4-dehydrorhamnose reductase